MTDSLTGSRSSGRIPSRSDAIYRVVDSMPSSDTPARSVPSPCDGSMLDAKKIIVPLNGYSTDVPMITLACQTSKRTKGRVYAIYVIEVQRTLPLDADLVEEREQADAILDR